MEPAILRGPGVQVMLTPETKNEVHVISARGLVWSCWNPSPEDIVKLAAGEPLWLIQRGPFIPEMSMRVGKQEDTIPVNFMRAAAKQALPGGDEHEQAVRKWKGDIKPIDRILGWVGVFAAFALIAFVGYLAVR